MDRKPFYLRNKTSVKNDRKDMMKKVQRKLQNEKKLKIPVQSFLNHSNTQVVCWPDYVGWDLSMHLWFILHWGWIFSSVVVVGGGIGSHHSLWYTHICFCTHVYAYARQQQKKEWIEISSFCPRRRLDIIHISSFLDLQLWQNKMVKVKSWFYSKPYKYVHMYLSHVCFSFQRYYKLVSSWKIKLVWVTQ